MLRDGASARSSRVWSSTLHGSGGRPPACVHGPARGGEEATRGMARRGPARTGAVGRAACQRGNEEALPARRAGRASGRCPRPAAGPVLATGAARPLPGVANGTRPARFVRWRRTNNGRRGESVKIFLSVISRTGTGGDDNQWQRAAHVWLDKIGAELKNVERSSPKHTFTCHSRLLALFQY